LRGGRHHPNIGVFGMWSIATSNSHRTKPNSADVRMMYSRLIPAPPPSTVHTRRQLEHSVCTRSSRYVLGTRLVGGHAKSSNTGGVPPLRTAAREVLNELRESLENGRRRKPALQGVSCPVRYQPTTSIRTEICRDTKACSKTVLGRLLVTCS
jgi:hypothetical protein